MTARVCSTKAEIKRVLTTDQIAGIISSTKQKHVPTHPEAVWLQPYCHGLTVDIGCGFEKVLPGILGIDKLGFGETGKTGCMLGQPSAADIQADAGDLFFITGATFDSVVSRHCFEHLPDPTATLREWLRILRPGGKLAMVLPNDHWRDFIALDSDHKFRCYPETVENALNKLNQEGSLKGKLLDNGRMVYPNWSFFSLIERV